MVTKLLSHNPRHELIDTVDRVISDAGEYEAQICFGIDVAQLCCADDVERLCQLVEAEKERRQERASSENVGRISGDFGDFAPRNESRCELFAIE
jgi:hypothetical protein